MRVRNQQMSVEKDVLANHGAKLAPVFTCTKKCGQTDILGTRRWKSRIKDSD